ncbi:prephenate dehydrogenase/arogenate dehydrogenase family protein [Streptomyces diacarni]|uniref:prephenate dehydrogenase/arogenate dehydrogenase family protein n=1 Tax=Streptomyces diacarni TaxID=2800381 RepID=UPI0033EC605D
MPIRTAAVVGTGLIGTSVALALRAQGVEVQLYDRRQSHVDAAVALGAGSVGRPSSTVGLAVIAVPPSHVSRVVTEAQSRELARCYTDVAK